MEVYKIRTIENLEVIQKKFLRKVVVNNKVETLHKLKVDNMGIDYRYSFKPNASADYDIDEHFIIKIDNINKVFYNKNENKLVIFFDYDIFDYIEAYNSDITLNKSEMIGVEDITDKDIKDECLEIDNIFGINLVEYFQRNGFNIDTNVNNLEEEIKAYNKRNKISRKITVKRKSIEVLKVN